MRDCCGWALAGERSAAILLTFKYGLALVAACVAYACTSPDARDRGADAPVARDESPDTAATVPATPFGEPSTLLVAKAELRERGASNELLSKIAEIPYRYFRLLATQFASRTCYEFRDLRWRLPVVAVHGDAHVTQFVVTRTTYGLEDFDRSGYGPAVVDLVRYAASIHLTCQQAGWPCDPEQAIKSYFDAYREALDRPVSGNPPSIVERLRGASPQDTSAWLRSADALMRPLSPTEDEAQRRSWERFVRLATEVRTDRPAGFYRILRSGHIEIGIGSALEKKILVHIRGATDAPTDDVMLEERPTTQPGANECVWRPAHGGSLHVFQFMLLLGRRMPDVYGFVPREDERGAPEFWVQSWDPGYRELNIADVRNQQELNELAVDAAHQLAGHFWKTFPEPLRPYQRFAQLRAFEMTETRARRLSRALADEAVAGWERFRAER